MKKSIYASVLGVSAVVFSGCGGSQSPSDALRTILNAANSGNYSEATAGLTSTHELRKTGVDYQQNLLGFGHPQRGH
jgi:fructoselysine-6-P-deglycase FrlB-like protein